MHHRHWESKVKDHFDNRSSTYADGYTTDDLFAYCFRTRQNIVTSLLTEIEPGRLLDVGCGPGVYASLCSENGFAYTGMDLSQQMIVECYKRYGNLARVNFVTGRLQALSFASGSFDVILCLGALEYVQTHEQAAALEELVRVLKPGGAIIFSCANKLSPYRLWGRVYSQLGSLIKKRAGVPIVDFTERSFRLKTQAHGLTSATVRYFAMNLFPSPLERKLSRQAVWVTSRLERFSSGLFGRLGMAFILVANKR